MRIEKLTSFSYFSNESGPSCIPLPTKRRGCKLFKQKLRENKITNTEKNVGKTLNICSFS